jgi:hypothetical protein
MTKLQAANQNIGQAVAIKRYFVSMEETELQNQSSNSKSSA